MNHMQDNLSLERVETMSRLDLGKNSLGIACPCRFLTSGPNLCYNSRPLVDPKQRIYQWISNLFLLLKTINDISLITLLSVSKKLIYIKIYYYLDFQENLIVYHFFLLLAENTSALAQYYHVFRLQERFLHLFLVKN